MEKRINIISKSSVVGTDISIKSEFHINEGSGENDELISLNRLSTDEIEILDKKKTKNGIKGMENELLINQNSDSIFQVDIDGSIVVSDRNVEDKYELNEMGELIFKF